MKYIAFDKETKEIHGAGESPDEAREEAIDNDAPWFHLRVGRATNRLYDYWIEYGTPNTYDRLINNYYDICTY